jgi:asparagine synthase (glutamine-hydrolysing)
MAASHGIDYVWPMLDRRLIQQWLSTPSIWKAGNARVGRYLHRMAVDGICPPDVAWKAEKDMGFSATYKLFDEKSNLDNFRLLAALSEKVSPPLSMIVDQGKISRLVTEGLRTDSRGYELCTALNQSVKQLDTILHWLQATN